jgi:hypothetical protein
MLFRAFVSGITAMTRVQAWWRATWGEAAAGFRADRPIYILIGVYSLLCAAYLLVRGAFHPGQVWETFLIYLKLWGDEYGIAFPAALAIVGLSHIIHRIDGRRHRRRAFGLMFGPVRMGRLIAGTLLLTMMLPFRTFFNSVKNAIPEGQGFPYDRIFADFDKALHFGVEPYRLLFGIGMQNGWVLRILEFNYNTLWFLVCFGALYWVAVSPRHNGLRLHYLICFVLVWGCSGGLLATVFSSAGPVYHDAIAGDPGRFAPLVAFLKTTSGTFGSAYDTQAYLWDLYVGQKPGLGSGISAFPSVHLGLITLNALFFRQINRRLAWIGYAYVLVILVTSVYLGWHYAIDGYASILLTVGYYFGTKALLSTRWVWARKRASAGDGAVA